MLGADQSAIWGPLFVPLPAAVFILAFSVYWAYPSISVGVFGILSLRGSGCAEARLARGGQPVARLAPHPARGHLPHVHEPIEVLTESLEYVERQDFPRGRVSVVVAFEERDLTAQDKMDALRLRFGGSFGSILFTTHPVLPGEVPGKSANLAWAMPLSKRALVDSKGIDPGNVLVTICDADTRLHSKYLSALTHEALGNYDLLSAVYQPPLSCTATSSGRQILLSDRSTACIPSTTSPTPARYRPLPLSTYSLSLASCERIGYWDPEVIPRTRTRSSRCCSAPRSGLRSTYLPPGLGRCGGREQFGRPCGLTSARPGDGRGAPPTSLTFCAAGGAAPVSGGDALVRVGCYLQDHLTWAVHWSLLFFGFSLMPFLAPAFWSSPSAIHLAMVNSLIITACSPMLLVMAIIDLRLRTIAHRRPTSLLVFAMGWCLCPSCVSSRCRFLPRMRSAEC